MNSKLALSLLTVFILMFSISLQGLSISGFKGSQSSTNNVIQYIPAGNGIYLLNSYYVYFNETGLPSGSDWKVVVNGPHDSGSLSTKTNQMIFLVPGGNYSVTVYFPKGYMVNSQIGAGYSILNQQNSMGGGKNISKGYVNVTQNTFINMNIRTQNSGTGTIIAASIVVSLIAILFVLYYYTRFSAKNKDSSK
ncbi:MAG: hypothetical protein ACYCSG_05490 [Thermoplasmataceae archaeon]